MFWYSHETWKNAKPSFLQVFQSTYKYSNILKSGGKLGPVHMRHCCLGEIDRYPGSSPFTWLKLTFLPELKTY